jgi:trehalose 6-phosphate phosphatase
MVGMACPVPRPPRPQLGDQFTGEGRWIEDKGASVTMHWREHADHEDSRLSAQRLADALTPAPHVIPGVMVLNCMPPGLPDKGDAVVHLLEEFGCAQALFSGDDVTDAAVFRRGDARIHGIQVGDLDLGAPHRVPSQRHVAAMLTSMVASLES